MDRMPTIKQEHFWGVELSVTYDVTGDAEQWSNAYDALRTRYRKDFDQKTLNMMKVATDAACDADDYGRCTHELFPSEVETLRNAGALA